MHTQTPAHRQTNRLKQIQTNVQTQTHTHTHTHTQHTITSQKLKYELEFLKVSLAIYVLLYNLTLWSGPLWCVWLCNRSPFCVYPVNHMILNFLFIRWFWKVLIGYNTMPCLLITYFQLWCKLNNEPISLRLFHLAPIVVQRSARAGDYNNKGQIFLTSFILENIEIRYVQKHFKIIFNLIHHMELIKLLGKSI